MAKLADFAITEVHYENGRISTVKRSELDDNNRLSNEKERTKKEVVDAILNKKLTYVTMSKKTKDTPRVRVVEGRTEKFLRTDRDETEKDNLGDLPTY